MELMKNNMSKDKGKAVPLDLSKNRDLDQLLQEKLLSDRFYSEIIESDEFQRLKSVSFLGAIDYVSPNNRSDRFKHSLDVGKLALYISEERNYSKEIKDHLVSAALLHDIGHAPLSHSMESSFFSEFGINHHVASTKIIREGKEKSSINNILKKFVDINVVIDLFEQKSTESFSDLFNSKINIDTIDGIHKSLAFANLANAYDKYSLAEAAFITSSYNKTKKLDRFWKEKDFVYKNIITSGIGAVADHISKEYFSDNISRIDESYFYKKESSLLKGSKPIFKNFTNKLKGIKSFDEKNIKKQPLINNFNIECVELNVIERNYKLNENVVNNKSITLNKFISDRYECNKIAKLKKVYYIDCEIVKEQYKLL
jgi:hypothetical protein